MAGGSATINLAVGENVTVTYTNTRQGSIRMIKDAEPNDAQDFEIDPSSNLQATNFVLDDDADGTNLNQVTSSLAPGTYDVAEISIPAGWTLGDISCPSATVTIGADSDLDAGDTGVSVTLAAGQNVTCTFYEYNEQGALTIVKDAQPERCTGEVLHIDPRARPVRQQRAGRRCGRDESEPATPSLAPGTYDVAERSIRPAGRWQTSAVRARR